MNTHLPSTHEAKKDAKQLRVQLAAAGTIISHTQSLERVAQQHGFRDWNTYVAMAADTGFAPGQRVSGLYLSQPFIATVVTAAVVRPGWTQIDLDLDEAVDVVTSPAFTNNRKRIRGVVGPKGWSLEQTSDGTAHLQIETLGVPDAKDR